MLKCLSSEQRYVCQNCMTALPGNMNSFNSILAAIIALWQDLLVLFSALRGFSPGTPQFCGRRGGLMVSALNS